MEGDEETSGIDVPEGMDEDASLAQVKMKTDAIDKLAPDPDEQDDRMSLITILRGKQPHLYMLYQADVEWEILSAYEEQREIDWKPLNPVTWIKNHAPSLQGRRSKEIVEIARSSQAAHKHSLFDILRGR